MVKIWLFGMISLMGIGCSSNSPVENNEPRIEETKIDGDLRASDIIRNPISASKPLDSSKVAKITFENKEFDFGTIPEGKVVNHTFKFQNTGKAPLVLGSVRSTCGCTIPKWSREPIAAGEYGEIDIRYNSSGKKGKQNKPIMINANTLPAESKIHIKGNVVPKK